MPRARNIYPTFILHRLYALKRFSQMVFNFFQFSDGFPSFLDIWAGLHLLTGLKKCQYSELSYEWCTKTIEWLVLDSTDRSHDVQDKLSLVIFTPNLDQNKRMPTKSKTKRAKIKSEKQERTTRKGLKTKGRNIKEEKSERRKLRFCLPLGLRRNSRFQFSPFSNSFPNVRIPNGRNPKKGKSEGRKPNGRKANGRKQKKGKANGRKH